VAINAIGAGFAQGFGQADVVGMLLVVDAGVKAQFVDHIVTLVLATRNADHAAASGLGQRAVGAAHRATGGADRHGFARLGRNDLDQAVPGRHARHAHGAQVMRQRHMRRVDLAQGAHQVGIDHAVFLPAAHAHNLVADGEFGMARLNHLAHRAADHDFAQGLGNGVAFAFVHAPAHVGVQAQVVVAHEHLALQKCRRLDFDEFEIADSGFTLRAVVEQELVVGGHVGLQVMFVNRSKDSAQRAGSHI